jgi:DNA-binding NarL/FixJ family response regulator
MRPPARFLIAEDEPYLARSLDRILSLFGETTIFTTAHDADVALFDGTSWCALILDIGLPDGSGLDLLARARQRHPTTPALLQTGLFDPELINRAYDLHASYIVKPVIPQRVERFARAAVDAAYPVSLASRLDSLVEEWVVEYELSEAEADVLLRAAQGDSREQIARDRLISPLTVKKHVNNLLKRTRDGSLHKAVERLLRTAAREPLGATRA